MIYLFILFVTLQPPAEEAVVHTDWTGFHGGSKAGVFENDKLPMEWSTTKNVAWVVDIPGLAWSSPVTWKGKVFLTTVI
ncbi:MAG TPA: hypothetical protein PKA06_06195, partial [Gemmatales bacterium]|nr:hypothetical protein [Gemmatales bacterium]